MSCFSTEYLRIEFKPANFAFVETLLCKGRNSREKDKQRLKLGLLWYPGTFRLSGFSWLFFGVAMGNIQIHNIHKYT